MSLFGDLAGQVLGNALGSNTQGGNPLLQIATTLLQQHGGLEGLLRQFQSSGLGEQAASWVGTGPNKSIDAGQLSAALGNGTLDALAGKFGLSGSQVSGGLADLLPQLIDRATPGGTTQGADDMLQQGFSVLEGLLRKPA
ncbi:YidB family protein [Viridibacterium curvum]|uniref:YidB family protein n=1 Tax=Viridibacterium curvum TaxID=1101404 RepID=A0ABP9QVK6_9RHOO